MDEPLKNIFRLQITSLSGFDFQDFVSELFLLKLGDKDFIPPRKVKDKGCDGIIHSERRVLACYAPENYNSTTFLTKINSDFESYRKYWEKEYPNWMFITNQDVSPEQIIKINELKKETPLIGIKNIIAIIENLDSSKRRKLGRYLRIDQEYFARDYLREILEDLLRDTDISDRSVLYSKPTYVPDKIELNYEKIDVEGATQEYDIVSDYFIRIEEIIKGFEDKEIDKIKLKIINDFNMKKGSFKERLEQQTLQYLDKYSPGDDDYLFFIRAILIYHFEQCLIGEKTGAEK